MTLILSGTAGLSDVDGSAATPAIRGTDTNTGIFFPAADTIAFAEGGAEIARFDSNGNFGLGVTPSAWGGGQVGLQVKNASLSGFSNAAYVMANTFYDGTNEKYIASSFACKYTQANGAHLWYSAASGTAGNNITFTQAMTLDASGNLGVGTTSPAAKAEFVSGTGAQYIGTFRTGDSTTANNVGGGFYGVSSATAASRQAIMWLDADGANFAGGDYFYIVKAGNSGNVDLIQASNAAMTFQVNGSERGRFTSGGFFKASNTGNYVNSAGAYHEFVSNDTTNTFIVRNTSTSTNTDGTIFISNVRNTTNGTYFIIGAYNTTAAAFKFIVQDSGNVQNTNNSYGAISDIKLKENIVDATPKLEKLNQVRVVNYNLIGDTQKQIGVIAQELEQIFPGMVEESPDYEEVTTTDEDGAEKTERVATGTTTKAVKYSVFVPMLIKAIQEQQALIAQLQADVAALKGTQP